MSIGWISRAALLAIAAAGASPASAASTSSVPALQPEELVHVQLPDRLKAHWLWVNDISFDRPLDGRAYLIDGDSGAFLGMVSGGYAQGPLQIAPTGDRFAMVSTYYSRGTRGDRTDVVTLYKTGTLDQTGEVVIPPKRFTSLPFLSAASLSDDGRFSFVYNFTPAQSVTVVDLAASKLVGEYPTPGCALIYPTGPRRFFMQCGDGSLQPVAVADDGSLKLGAATPKLFADSDPANEKPVRISPSQWLFTTFDSEVRVIDWSDAMPVLQETWSLLPAPKSPWRIGGLQPADFHQASGQLFTLMHQGGRATHKDPGTEVWVYDVKSKKRLRQIKLAEPATAIAVSADSKPLLYAAMFGVADLVVYDAVTGKKLRKIRNLGNAITVLQPAPAGSVQ
jgi:methylamine dehydrogenase heavy chain